MCLCFVKHQVNLGSGRQSSRGQWRYWNGSLAWREDLGTAWNSSHPFRGARGTRPRRASGHRAGMFRKEAQPDAIMQLYKVSPGSPATTRTAKSYAQFTSCCFYVFMMCVCLSGLCHEVCVVSGQPQASTLTFHLVWESLFSFWVHQARWPMSL